jgi:hypothetical protein
MRRFSEVSFCLMLITIKQPHKALPTYNYLHAIHNICTRVVCKKKSSDGKSEGNNSSKPPCGKSNSRNQENTVLRIRIPDPQH